MVSDSLTLGCVAARLWRSVVLTLVLGAWGVLIWLGWSGLMPWFAAVSAVLLTLPALQSLHRLPTRLALRQGVWQAESVQGQSESLHVTSSLRVGNLIWLLFVQPLQSGQRQRLQGLRVVPLAVYAMDAHTRHTLALALARGESSNTDIQRNAPSAIAPASTQR